jgi:hypothetical protein
MGLYLAQFTLETSYYMSNRVDKSMLIRIIEANSEEEATIKLHKEYKVNYDNYEDKTKSFQFKYDYDTSNSFYDLIITESIK